MKKHLLLGVNGVDKYFIYMKDNLDIRKSCNLVVFLKPKSDGYRLKKIFTRVEIETFPQTLFNV